MPKRRKEGNKFTTISISWDDKEMLRKYAQFKRDTKNGKLYETDSEVFHKILELYKNAKTVVHVLGKPTYPTVLQDKS